MVSEPENLLVMFRGEAGSCGEKPLSPIWDLQCAWAFVTSITAFSAA